MKEYVKYPMAAIGSVLAMAGAEKAVSSLDDYVSAHPPQAQVWQASADYLSEIRQGLEGVAYAGDEEIEKARKLLIKGDKIRRDNDNYTEAIPFFQKALSLYEKNADNITTKQKGNYAATLVSLADCLINETLASYFEDNHKLPNSIELLKEGREYAFESLEILAEYSQIGQKENSEANVFESWAYNLIGKSTKYLGNPEEAEQFYKKALKENPNNDDAAHNLNLAWDNYTIFIR